MKIELNEQQILEAAMDFEGDIDFMENMINKLTRNHDETESLIIRLYNGLPDYKQESVKELLKENYDNT